MPITKTPGIDFSCYAEFKCDQCGKWWTSLKTGKLNRKTCGGCKNQVKAHTIQPLYYYECTRCNITWKNKSIVNGMPGMPCRRCKSTIHPKWYKDFNKKLKLENRRPNFNTAHNPNNSKSAHQSSLCEKCKLQGGNCMESANSR